MNRDQEPGGRGTGNLNLVQNEDLQKELNITPDQVAKIRQIPLLIKEKLKDQFAEMEKLEGKERREKSRELRKAFSEAVEELGHIIVDWGRHRDAQLPARLSSRPEHAHSAGGRLRGVVSDYGRKSDRAPSLPESR